MNNSIIWLAFLPLYLLSFSLLKGVRAGGSFVLALDSLRIISKKWGKSKEMSK